MVPSCGFHCTVCVGSRRKGRRDTGRASRAVMALQFLRFRHQIDCDLFQSVCSCQMRACARQPRARLRDLAQISHSVHHLWSRSSPRFCWCGRQVMQPVGKDLRSGDKNLLGSAKSTEFAVTLASSPATRPHSHTRPSLLRASRARRAATPAAERVGERADLRVAEHPGNP